MPTPQLNLDKNPDFIADLHDGTLRNKDISEKWGTSNGYVSDRRARLRKGLPLEKSALDKALDGESTEITTNDDGTKKFNFIRHRPVTLEDARDLIRSTGDDPDLYNISIRTISYGVDQSSNKISAWPKQGMALVESLKLSHLYAAGAKRHFRQPVDTQLGRGLAINVADWQIGKTGRRGGTPELLERLSAARDALEVELEKRRPEAILLADLGDGIEGFESGGNPMGTNDLSLPDQLDCYATEIYKFVELAARYAPVSAAVVPSNHASWRRGKQNLGKPSDDFGIFVHKQVEKTAHAAGIEASWSFPHAYDESMCVDLLGTPIGLIHGNQFGPGKAVDYWAAQAFGDQALTRADVMVHGHYHAFFASVAGMNPATGRERMALCAPTLDSGSDWYRNIKGRDSLPGTLIFEVSERGFDLASLTIL